MIDWFEHFVTIKGDNLLQKSKQSL